ncbi:hypothetical protein [Streptomyces sulphureus]|uniref:hypothetical protein n=1 Tax=Streptomyces sulphureus TaxID=47758 RepID=UPI00036A2FDD|nr:hypothetical protein [Streptomyces sulphureus]
MEDAGGNTVEETLLRTRKSEEQLGRPLDVETVLAYGCKILDLGGIRPPTDETPPVATLGHPSPEMGESPRLRTTVARDIHTVGRALENHAHRDVPGLGIASLKALARLCARAVSSKPPRRSPWAVTRTVLPSEATPPCPKPPEVHT